MWTPATRRHHSRAGLRYETDLTDAEWAVIAPFMPEPAACGRPATWTTREILNAIFYVLRGGIAWRLIPKDLPPKSTAFGYFSRWRDEGLFGRINHHLVMADRERVGREASPTAVVLDSQSVKTTEFPFAWRTRACRKLWRRPQDGLCPTPVSHFVNLWKTEAEREQPVLLAHGPRAGKAEALAQPQHGFEPLDGPSRRVEGLEAAHPRHGPLDPEVIALDALLQVLGHVMHRRARQQAVFPGCGDGGRVGPRPIGADPIRGEERLLLQHLAKEPLGRVEIALGREQEVDRRAVLVDGPVQIAPLAADLDVCLVDPDRTAMGLAEGPQSLLDQGRIGQHPAVQGGVVHLQTALQQQLLDVAVAQGIAEVPRDGLEDQRRFEMASFEISLRPALQLLGNRAQDHRPPPVRRRICRP